MKKAHQPINHISKTIQEFNRECEEEKLKGNSNLQKKYEKRIQNYGIDMNSKIGEGTFSKVYKGKDL
jgi:predicted transcriptional regulator